MTDYVPGHGDHRFHVEHYDLTLSYRVDANRLTGRAAITAVALEELTSLTLDLHGLHVTKVSVDGRAPRGFTHRSSRLEIRLTSAVPVGTRLTVHVGYDGTPTPVPGPDGEAGWEELADGVIVASQPYGAPSWFPCNDRPSDKASYHIEVTAPSAYRVVANGVPVSTRRGASTTTWEFEQPEPMAPYLATVQIGRYVVHELESAVPISVMLPQARIGDVETAFSRQVAMMDTFTKLFGAYPYSTYTVVVTDDELEIPVEAQTMSTFGSNFLSDSWASERLIAHELSHQWFGNSLTAETWKDIWLHEGFACYAEWLWSEQSGREDAQHHAEHFWVRLNDLDQDLLLGDPGPDLMFDDRVYKRGALLLHALRLSAGDDTFFDLLRAWASGFAHGTVRTDDFIALAEEVTQQSLRPLFDQWLYATGLPELPAVRG